MHVSSTAFLGLSLLSLPGLSPLLVLLRLALLALFLPVLLRCALASVRTCSYLASVSTMSIWLVLFGLVPVWDCCIPGSCFCMTAIRYPSNMVSMTNRTTSSSTSKTGTFSSVVSGSPTLTSHYWASF